MRLIGLTGGIATGKTSVGLCFLNKYECPFLDVDEVARNVTAKGTNALQKIVEQFGEECLTEDSCLNVSYLKSRITGDKAAAALENIVVPAISLRVLETIEGWEAAGKEIAFIENAAMIENGTYVNYDEILVVTSSEEAQVARLMTGVVQDEQKARDMITSQMPLSEKEKLATYIIRNEGDISNLKNEVDRVWKEICGVENESR